MKKSLRSVVRGVIALACASSSLACGGTDAGRGEDAGSTTTTSDGGAADAAPEGPDTYGLRGVWGSASDDVWFVGQGGKIVHFDGKELSLFPSPTTYALRSVSGSSADDVWAVGDDVVIHWDGSAWTEMLKDMEEHLLDVWTSAPNDVWTSGVATDVNLGLLRHFDGTDWAWTTIGSATSLWAVWGSSATDVWTGGQAYLGIGAPTDSSDGFLSHGNGTEFDVADYPGGSLRKIWGVGADDFWVAPYDGPLHHWNGSEWAIVDRPAEAQVLGAAGLASGESWVVGNAGTVFHYDGAEWEALDVQSTANFISVWAAATDDVWLVGSKGTVMHFDGKRWKHLGAPSLMP